MAHRRPTLRAGRVARRLVCDLPGGDVGGDCGQFRIRPRRECLAYPRIELVFGNPTMHKRGLEHVDYVLAVSMGRPEAAASRRGYRHLVFRLCCHRRLPTSTVQRSLARRRCGGQPRIISLHYEIDRQLVFAP
ncbi:MAG: hypothetical protein ABR926_14720 [Streptosporangiaceae bacterium]|jgi:hypothetical protein